MRGKKEEGKYYNSWKYKFYGMSAHQMGLSAGRSMLQLHQVLDPLDIGPFRPEVTGLLTQEADTSGPMLVDAHNGLNELIRLDIL